MSVAENLMGAMNPSRQAIGGTRMGNHPDANVVNVWGFTHAVPNFNYLGRFGDGHEWGA